MKETVINAGGPVTLAWPNSARRKTTSSPTTFDRDLRPYPTHADASFLGRHCSAVRRSLHRLRRMDRRRGAHRGSLPPRGGTGGVKSWTHHPRSVVAGVAVVDEVGVDDFQHRANRSRGADVSRECERFRDVVVEVISR